MNHLTTTMIARETVCVMRRYGLVVHLVFSVREDQRFDPRTDSWQMSVWSGNVCVPLQYRHSDLSMCLDDFSAQVIEPAVRDYVLSQCQYDDAGQII